MNNLSARSRTIVPIAIVFFALAGLISGFSVGAFIRPGLQQASNPNPAVTPTLAGQPRTPVRTPPTSNPIPLGFPKIEHVSFSEVADGSTSYTLTTQAVTELANGEQGSPVHASGITCKLWLVQEIPANGKFKISTAVLQNINAIQNPITGQVNGVPFPEIPVIAFDSNSQQTHFCTPKGRGIWKYQLSTSVPPGSYDLVVLTDWNGIHYNWSWAEISITK